MTDRKPRELFWCPISNVFGQLILFKLSLSEFTHVWTYYWRLRFRRFLSLTISHAFDWHECLGFEHRTKCRVALFVGWLGDFLLSLVYRWLLFVCLGARFLWLAFLDERFWSANWAWMHLLLENLVFDPWFDTNPWWVATKYSAWGSSSAVSIVV